MNIKGSLPLIILQTLSQGASHGYGIAQQIKAQSKGVLFRTRPVAGSVNAVWLFVHVLAFSAAHILWK